MKKKIVTLMLASMTALSVTACGGGSENADSSAETKTESTETEAPKEKAEEASADDGIIDFTTDEYNVKYVKHETGTDYEGNPCLLFYYTFTNSSDDNASAAVGSYIQCFQNGVECDTAILMDSNEAIDNYMNEVQPGTTIEVCQAYSIADTSEVTIEASALVSLDGEKDTQKIALQ